MGLLTSLIKKGAKAGNKGMKKSQAQARRRGNLRRRKEAQAQKTQARAQKKANKEYARTSAKQEKDRQRAIDASDRRVNKKIDEIKNREEKSQSSSQSQPRRVIYEEYDFRGKASRPKSKAITVVPRESRSSSTADDIVINVTSKKGLTPRKSSSVDIRSKVEQRTPDVLDTRKALKAWYETPKQLKPWYEK
jgi:hypothetical protein